MPYSSGRAGSWERARRLGHVPVVENQIVRERLANYRVRATEGSSQLPNELLVSASLLDDPGELPRWAMSFDGSQSEVAVREEYPSTRIGYVQIAGVLIHLEEMLSQAAEHLVDPYVIRQASDEALYSIVVPSSNVARSDMSSLRDSWRAEVFEILQTYTVEDSTLLDVFMRLVGHSDKQSPAGGIILARCPASESCTGRDIDVPRSAGTCPSCGGQVFPTDSLRIHEEVAEEHSNLTAIGRLMSFLEHLTMVGYLQFLLRRQPRSLANVAFIMDGPLAVFGPQAWLHAAIQCFIDSLSRELQSQSLGKPIIVGLEKTGQFAEHAAAIADRIQPRTLMLLPDQYIYDHVLASRHAAASQFGRDTYYGQKFFYRTEQGHLLTLTTPRAPELSGPWHDPSNYQILSPTLRLLDAIGTNLYTDAVIPIALAHSYASIPLRTGSRVLTLLSRQLLSSAQDGDGSGTL